MALLETIPLWAWWAGGFAVFASLYIWGFDDNLKEQTRGFIKSYGVWIIVILVFIWGRSNWGYWQPSESLIHFSRVSDTFLIVFTLVILLGRMFLGRERYMSTQAVADNRSGSCAQYQEVGDYVILNIGSCDADMFPWLTGHETWVVPKRHFGKINGNANKTRGQIVIPTIVEKTDANGILEVSPECHDFIESAKGYDKENIYYGEFSRDEILVNAGEKIKDPNGRELSLKDYETKLKDTNRLLNEARIMIKGKTKALLGFISHTGEIMKKAKGTDAPPQQYNPDGSQGRY